MRTPIFTVFTPTYNRSQTLPRVYGSLKTQIYRNFEWIVVDDGSIDETNKLVTKWQKEAEFPIHYFWQQNEGKHVAFNRGVQEARGEFFLTLDSDDACLPEALERLKFHWDSIPLHQKEFFTGVCGLCVDQHGKIVGDRFPFHVTDSNSLEIHYRYKVTGEKWGFQRTDILHRYPFPEIKNVKFVPEGIVWNAIAKSYKVRFVNEILRIYWSQTMADSDQLTHSLGNARNHAVGCALYYESCLNEHISWFRYAPLEFLRSAIHYVRFSLHSGIGTMRSLWKIRPKLAKGLFLIALPIGGTVFVLERRNIDVVSKGALVIRTIKALKLKLFGK